MMEKEAMINMVLVTVPEYARITGKGEAAVRRECEQGLLQAEKTEGGQWRIFLTAGDSVPRKLYEEVQAKNQKLSTTIETLAGIIKNTLGSMEI